MGLNIKFGTDGWRSRMDVDFNENNVAIVAQAIAEHLISVKRAEKVFIGYDTRRNSRKFARVVAEVMAGNSIHPIVSFRDCPTPVTAFAVKKLGTDGAVMITASHNPPVYNGIKFIPHYAGPANKEITDDIVQRIPGIIRVKRDTRDIEEVDISGEYRSHIMRLVEEDLDGLTVVTDLMYGTARGYLDVLLDEMGAKVIRLHDHPDPEFGGHQPEPQEKFLGELKEAVRKHGAFIGVACDGDADRLGGIDNEGSYISPNMAFANIYLWMLLKDEKGDAGRTVATTHLVDRIAKEHGYRIYETPVGFKYLAQLFLENKIVIGGEESGGISIKKHLPEKDGILSNILLIKSMLEHESSHKALEALFRKYGRIYNARIQVSGGPPDVNKLKSRASSIERLAGKKVIDLITIDGLKFVLEGDSWGLIRPSGTEPVIRIYAESPSMELTKQILDEIARLLKEQQ